MTEFDDDLIRRIRRRLAWQRRYTLVCAAACVWTAVDQAGPFAVGIWAGSALVSVVLCKLTAGHLNEAIRWAESSGRR